MAATSHDFVTIMGAAIRAASDTLLAGADDKISRVVYHLSDLDKVSFVAGNIQAHLDGVGGPSFGGFSAVTSSFIALTFCFGCCDRWLASLRSLKAGIGLLAGLTKLH